MRRARWKRKSVCSKLAHRCKFGGNGFCENCCAGEELRTKSRAGCRACPALYAVLIVASNLRVQRGHPLPPFPLPLPLSLEGFPKGRNRSFAPLSRVKGVRGEIEIPPRFSLGGRGGHSLFKREYPLGFSVPNRYSSAGNPGNLFGKTKRKWGFNPVRHRRTSSHQSGAFDISKEK